MVLFMCRRGIAVCVCVDNWLCECACGYGYVNARARTSGIVDSERGKIVGWMRCILAGSVYIGGGGGYCWLCCTCL